MSKQRYFVRVGSRDFTVDVENVEPGRHRAHVEGEPAPRELSVLAEGRSHTLSVEGRILELFEGAEGAFLVQPGRCDVVVTARRGKVGAGARGSDESRVVAPMPGRVLKLFVTEGQVVSRGGPVAVVEAMKMENELVAPRDGTVKRVLVRAGDTVERQALLVELE
jgi:biotin carboxyl carrier protein